MGDTRVRELADFLNRFDIRQVCITRDTDIRKDATSLISLRFNPEPGNPAAGYQVSFKLLDGCADIHRHVCGIGPPPECLLELTAKGRDLSSLELEELLGRLLETIGPRVAGIHKEQSILNTRPVGKAFVLASGTRFEVLSENSDGRLAIRILRGDGPSEAAMAANDLLDGLHTGIIRPA